MESHVLTPAATRAQRAAPVKHDVAADTLDRFAALYIAVAVAVTIAPALGIVGSALRLGMAIASTAALVVVLAADRGGVRLRSREQAALALFVGAIAVAAVNQIGFAYGVSRTINWLMFWPLAVLFVHRPRFKGLAVAAITVGAIQVLGVALQYRGLFGGVWGGTIISGDSYNPLTSEWLSRYTGFVQNPNDLGILMVLCGCAAVAVAQLTKGTWATILALSSVIAFTTVLVLTGSRGAIAALAIAALVYSVLVGAKNIAYLSIISLALIVIAQQANWQALDGVLGTIGDLVSGTDRSASGRLLIWNAYSLEPGQYLTGLGFGGYDTVNLANSGFNVDRNAAVSATVDNGWLKLWLEGGLLAIFSFSALLLTAFMALYDARRADVNRLLVAALSAGLLALVWRTITIDALDTNPYNAIIPLLVGAAWSLGRTPAQRAP